MKISLLIVDDEPKVRGGLVRLISEWAGDWETLEPCADGRSALATLRSRQVDVLLTDIRMPGVDGLRLTEEALRVSPATVVVIISGYQEFEYAQRAIRSGVIGFVVKPVDERELFEVLDRARAEVKRRRKLRAEQGALDDRYVEDALLAALVASDGEAEAARRLGAALDIDREWYVLLCVRFPERGGVEETLLCTAPPVALEAEREKLRNTVASLRGHRGTHLLLHGNELIVVVTDASREAAIERARELDRLIASYRRTPDLPEAVTGSSGAHTGHLELWRAYREACGAAQALFYRDSGAAQGEGAEERGLPVRRTEALQERLLACLGGGDREATASYAREFLELHAAAKLPLPALEEQVRLLATRIKERIDPSFVDAGTLETLVDPIALVGRYWDFVAFAADFAAHLDRLAAKVSGTIARRTGRAVQLAIEYIAENYRRDLPLEEVAHHVSLSASYFSSNFKKETGRSFVEYLTEYRLEKAKSLLTGTNLRMIDVADSVGFRDPKYFARTFREAIGLTPTRYRKCALTGDPP